MPLLNDAKTCYVGTTPITTVMAGSVQVWPKGTLPVGPFDKLKIYEGTSTNPIGQFLSWETVNRPSNCGRASSYAVEYFNPDPNNNGWVLVTYFGERTGWSWLPANEPLVMAVYIGPTDYENDVGPTYRVRFESSPGVFQYSSQRTNASNIGHSRLPDEYQENECSGKPYP